MYLVRKLILGFTYVLLGFPIVFNDFLIDHAKINKLRNASRRKRAEGRSKRLTGDNSILGVTVDFNMAQLVEEVCETVCAGHTFRKTHSDHNAAFYEGSGSRTDSTIIDGSTDLTKTDAVKENVKGVVVTLDVAPFVSWIVRSQPGALRRIVMNLLGNALKYTESGYIRVSLLQEKASSHTVAFTLSVEDSGKGMSAKYQQTKLFAPFSQEDPFSSGTGLGLSIVKQIVESLKGKIVRFGPNHNAKVHTNFTTTLGLEEYHECWHQVRNLTEATRWIE
jgi:signal transduction histidine kinase